MQPLFLRGLPTLPPLSDMSRLVKTSLGPLACYFVEQTPSYNFPSCCNDEPSLVGCTHRTGGLGQPLSSHPDHRPPAHQAHQLHITCSIYMQKYLSSFLFCKDLRDFYSWASGKGYAREATIRKPAPHPHASHPICRATPKI